ncbi:DUF4199 domain-containing protein [Marinirhabdus gelatinilytica]|uniref:Uncharacterized protein DUF4199 n=1 Tax=Marinirhabdus gelatinilytica TaxID=1703343 RepID=A0A370QIL6_9FLAO|nr:DUF4199 domain-containing protein [Marinirhabdus gelatinilytica]RDK88182.1 uncharacterized protein DUF4199 [Marinirhabdus gelatinilytica]
MSKIYLKYGVLIAIGLIIYFVITKLMGLHRYPVLSAANGVIYGAGILMALKSYKTEKNKFKYQKGFQVGFMSGAIATLIFVAFMAINMYQIDTEFSRNILDTWGLNYDSGTFIILISLVLMGLSTSLVLTLAFMQLLKESWNTKDGNRNQPIK